MLVLFQDKGTFYWSTLLFYDRRHFLLALFFLDAYFPVFRRALFYFFARFFIKISLQFFLIRHTFEKACSHYLLFSPTFFDDHTFYLKSTSNPSQEKYQAHGNLFKDQNQPLPFKKFKVLGTRPRQPLPTPYYSLTNSVTNKYNIYI